MIHIKSILFIAHYFPPLGGAGVQRSIKLVKYLPGLGILPVVVTGPGTASGRWSPLDPSMLQEIPPAVTVYRAEWQSSADRAGALARRRRQAFVDIGERAAHENSVDLILVSMSPFNDAGIAEELSRRLSIPWVADLRDPWALDEFQVYRTRWHRIRERYRMQRSLRTASLIIMNTPEAALRLRNAFPSCQTKRIVAITNGYDSQDFSGEIPAASRKSFTIVHSGYLHTEDGLHQRRHDRQYRLLGRVAPGVDILARSHFYLLQALERWLRDDPAIGDQVKLLLVGKPSAADEEQVKASSAASLIRFTGYLSHTESLRHVRAADLLFLPMHKLPAGQRATIVPGKTYEYMATGLPILAPVPEGDARDFLREAGTGLLCQPDDVDGMVRILKTQFQAWLAGATTVTWNKTYVEQFERRQRIKLLASEMRALDHKGSGSEDAAREASPGQLM